MFVVRSILLVVSKKQLPLYCCVKGILGYLCQRDAWIYCCSTSRARTLGSELEFANLIVRQPLWCTDDPPTWFPLFIKNQHGCSKKAEQAGPTFVSYFFRLSSWVGNRFSSKSSNLRSSTYWSGMTCRRLSPWFPFFFILAMLSVE
jgi:hypothetical protein